MIHCIEYISCIFSRNFYKCILVIHINGTDQAAGNTSFTGNRTKNIPRSCLLILTYINNQVGAQVAEGSQVAIISDLSHFKVEGEIADTYGDRVAAGGRAIVKIGNEKLEGTVSSVTPLSKNGVISFIVQLNEDNNKRLRSGLKTDVYVMNAVKEDVMRIANASYYVGRGEYELFVQDSDNEIIKRKVQLGDSNFEYVEVVSGLQPGDKVVVSDMSNYKNKSKLKVK